MKLTFIISTLIITFIGFSQEKQFLKPGNWISELQLNDQDVLPFNMKVQKGNNITIINGDEMIKMNDPIYFNDSVKIKFPFFNSELIFKIISKKQVNGYWVNYNKGSDYKIPFHSEKRNGTRFGYSVKSKKINLNGKWEVLFEPGKESAYPAAGIFRQENKKNNVSGTFLTETGDYRYLAGNIVHDSLFLSCFDGSHAFLFKAAYLNDTLYGTFNSGSHWKSEWKGKRNENFELKSPEELTYLKEGTSVQFKLNDIYKESFSFPNESFNNKVVIIQIMGTWCPNFLDETMYFKELYDNYHSTGLEIISVCYEAADSEENQIKSITRYKEKLEVDFTFLVGGQASKDKAAKQFNMLNDIISFPTTIIIGRDGKVKLVHTGFNGPGTGKYYINYVAKMNAFIESLLAQ